ncbi:hypothetical protein BKA83DRAFT_4219387 [Pisolithus microcarpus]|nr:hypothetical protein BKA83DRAFT_4219387 [Pisolithus microcarpus]
MGLAGRKVKRRIPADPRNLSWADDASRFGQSYLSKFGWDAAQGVGLGASGDGMKSHLKVSHKLDMLGIGAAHKKDPHGIAWKQNKDFEALLQRLNGGKEEKDSAVEQGGFVSATKGKAKEDGTDGEDVTIPRDKKRKGKRKHHDEGDGSRERDKKRKKKQKVETQGTNEGGATEDKPLNVADDDTLQNDDAPTPSSMKATETNDFRPKPKGRPMAHRARFQAAKRLATKSTAAIAEILGIAPSSSTPPSLLATPKRSSSTPEPFSTPEDAQPSLEKLTTSTKSLADYFRDKLAAKKSTVFTPILPDADDDNDPPRSGLGVSRVSLPSRADEAPQRMGLGFASLTLTGTPTALESTLTAQGTQVIPAPGPRVQNGYNQENHDKNKRKGSKRSKILGTGIEGGAQRQELQAHLEADNKDAGRESIGRDSGDAKIKKDSRHEDPTTENLDTSVKIEVKKKRREAKGNVTGSDKSKRKSRKGSE